MLSVRPNRARGGFSLGDGRPRAHRLGIVLALALSACGSTGEPVGEPRPLDSSPNAGAPIDLPDAPVYAEIARLEDGRTDGGGRLEELLQDPDAAVRRRAAEALGRLPLETHRTAVTSALCDALGDPAPVVRAAAAFALGLRADRDCAPVLLNYWNDSDALVRARIVEAASRIDEPALRREILHSMGDESELVRIEAVIAPHRWATDAPDALEVDEALLEVLSLYPSLPPPQGDLDTPGREIVWRTLFTLQRRRSPVGRGAFLQFAASTDVRTRLFATKGLARTHADAATLRALRRATNDGDWRIVCEALLGLEENVDAANVPAILARVEHSSPHVRRLALQALGAYPEQKQEILPAIWRGTRDLSADARAAALVSLAKLLPPDEARDQVSLKARARDPVERRGAAVAASHLRADLALPLLKSLLRDPDLLVAGSAVESLGTHATPKARAALLELFSQPDLGLQLAAVLALREGSQATDLEHLLYALGAAFDSRADVAPELCFNLLESLGTIGGPKAELAVRRGLEHADPWVRRVAVRVLERDFPEAAVEALEGSGPAYSGEVPEPGRDYPDWKRNPMVEVVTSRGSLIFELFPAEAPLHVHSFLTLARASHFDGLRFHRVVPDFVIQGGDYRGDGNGGKSWRGDSLRHEVTPRKYQRGSLGMPRNENFESGGSQIFVCHRPTPHLDGRYTIFGELREGLDVLDRIEVGDRILGIVAHE